MKQSQYNSYDDLPLFLNAEAGAPGKTQHSGFAGERRRSGMSKPCRLRQGEGYGACGDGAKVLGVSSSTSYELMHEPGFPVLNVGSRMVVPKKAFIQWVTKHTEGGARE